MQTAPAAGGFVLARPLLVTVGSPLEKLRFLWARLFPDNPAWTVEWVNVLTPSDPVSGWLKRFDASGTLRVVNRRLGGGLGGYGEAHAGYFRNPRVMGDVAANLGASEAGVEGYSWLLPSKFLARRWQPYPTSSGRKLGIARSSLANKVAELTTHDICAVVF